MAESLRDQAMDSLGPSQPNLPLASLPGQPQSLKNDLCHPSVHIDHANTVLSVRPKRSQGCSHSRSINIILDERCQLSKEEILTQATAQMHVENIALNEMSHTQQDKRCVLPLT